MSQKREGLGRGLIILVIVLMGIAGMTVRWIYHTKHPMVSKIPKTVSSQRVMTLTSRGGLCDGPCEHPSYAVYENGIFEGHKNLTNSEVTELKNVLNSTDISKYGLKSQPFCDSFADGSDQVLQFPQKYGDKEFVPCLLDIPSSDPVFSFINRLLESHSK